MANKLQAVRDMENAAFGGDWNTFQSYLSDDVFYRVGNDAEVRGPKAVSEYLISLLSTRLAITDLQPRAGWETSDTVILELNMKGQRLGDKKEVAYPCIDVYRFNSEGKINDWRVYAIESTYVK